MGPLILSKTLQLIAYGTQWQQNYSRSRNLTQILDLNLGETEEKIIVTLKSQVLTISEPKFFRQYFVIDHSVLKPLFMGLIRLEKLYARMERHRTQDT